jgi:hypothetical protein
MDRFAMAVGAPTWSVVKPWPLVVCGSFGGWGTPVRSEAFFNVAEIHE